MSVFSLANQRSCRLRAHRNSTAVSHGTASALAARYLGTPAAAERSTLRAELTAVLLNMSAGQRRCTGGLTRLLHRHRQFLIFRSTFSTHCNHDAVLHATTRRLTAVLADSVTGRRSKASRPDDLVQAAACAHGRDCVQPDGQNREPPGLCAWLFAQPSVCRQNSELLTLTYGAIVTQLIKDYKEVKVVNTELEKMCVGANDHSVLTLVRLTLLQGLQHWRAVS